MMLLLLLLLLLPLLLLLLLRRLIACLRYVSLCSYLTYDSTVFAAVDIAVVAPINSNAPSIWVCPRSVRLPLRAVPNMEQYVQEYV